MDEEVKVAILEQKQEVLEQFVQKLDSAIEKIAEVNTNVSKMLAVHEEKISKQEEIDGILFTKIDELRAKTVKHEIPKDLLGIGVRIEDDIVCTNNGPMNLTENAPKTIEEIEAATA